MTSNPHVTDPHDLDLAQVTADDADERPVDGSEDASEIPVPLDAELEVPIVDAIDQQRTVPLDDERDDA